MTQEEFYEMKRNQIREAALLKSRLRTLPKPPLKPGVTLLSEEEWRKKMQADIASALSKYNELYQLLNPSTFSATALNASIDRTQLMDAYAMAKEDLDGLIRTLNHPDGYANYVQDNCVGNSCAYTASDNYGLNWMVSSGFQNDYDKYGFTLVPWELRKPGDVILHLNDKGIAHHTNIYNGLNLLGLDTHNYSDGACTIQVDEKTGEVIKGYKKNSRYIHNVDPEKEYLVYTYTGTPQDLETWGKEYQQFLEDLRLLGLLKQEKEARESHIKYDDIMNAALYFLTPYATLPENGLITNTYANGGKILANKFNNDIVPEPYVSDEDIEEFFDLLHQPFDELNKANKYDLGSNLRMDKSRFLPNRKIVEETDAVETPATVQARQAEAESQETTGAFIAQRDAEIIALLRKLYGIGPNIPDNLVRSEAEAIKKRNSFAFEPETRTSDLIKNAEIQFNYRALNYHDALDFNRYNTVVSNIPLVGPLLSGEPVDEERATHDRAYLNSAMSRAGGKAMTVGAATATGAGAILSEPALLSYASGARLFPTIGSTLGVGEGTTSTLGLLGAATDMGLAGSMMYNGSKNAYEGYKEGDWLKMVGGIGEGTLGSIPFISGITTNLGAITHDYKTLRNMFAAAEMGSYDKNIIKGSQWYADVASKYGKKSADLIVDFITTKEFQSYFWGKDPAIAALEAQEFANFSTFKQLNPVTNSSSLTGEEWDKLYFDALSKGDMQTAEMLRREHFRQAAPNTKWANILYRGVDNPSPIMDLSKMEVADTPAIYTTPYYKYALLYGENVFSLYANIENPWLDTFEKLYSFYNPNNVERILSRKQRKGRPLGDLEDIYNSLLGADAFYRWETVPTGNPNVFTEERDPLEILIRDPNKVKSANTVTYDDAGNIIPLSQRDNFDSPDIRYLTGDALSVRNTPTPDYTYPINDATLNYIAKNLTLREIDQATKGDAVERMLEYFKSEEYALRLKESGIPVTLELIVQALENRINNNNYFPGRYVQGRFLGPSNVNNKDNPVLGQSNFTEILINEDANKDMILQILDHELAHYSTYNIGSPSIKNYNYVADLYDNMRYWGKALGHDIKLFNLYMRTPEQLIQEMGITDPEKAEAFLNEIDFKYLQDPQEVRSRLYAMDLYAKKLGMTFDELVDKYTFEGLIDNTSNDLRLLQLLGYLFSPENLKTVSKKYLSTLPWIAGTAVGGNYLLNSQENEDRQYANGGKLNKYDGESEKTLLMSVIPKLNKTLVGKLQIIEPQSSILTPNFIIPNEEILEDKRVNSLESRALNTMRMRVASDKPFNDYYQALDMSYPRKVMTSFTDKSVSNCTLNATSAYGPEYIFANARNVLQSPLFRQVTGDEIVPGTMLIQSLPDVEDGKKNIYHSAIFSGTADHPYINLFGDNIQIGDSLYIYSTGKNEPGAMRERPKAALMNNNGKTFFRYFRPNEAEKKSFGGNIYDGETLDTLQMDVRVPILKRRPLTEDLKLKIIVYDPDGNIIENPTHAIFDSETGQPVSGDFYNNGRYSFNGVEHLEPVEVIGLAPKKEVPWYNNDMFGFLIGDLRVNTVRNTLARNPNALDNWDVAGNAMEFANIASAGLLNRLSPTQNIGLAIDTFLGDNIMNSWFGNSGIVSDKFLLEHPYWSMAINGIGDAASYSLLNRFRTTSLFRDPNKVYHSDKGNGTGFTGNGAYTLDGYLHPGLTRLEGQSNYIWWNEGEPFSPGFSPKNSTTRMIVADTDMVPGLMRVRDLNYRIGQWNPAAKKSFVRTSEMVTPKSVPMENLDVYRRIPRTELWFRTNTAGPLGWYGMRNLSGVKLALGVGQRYVVRSNVDDYTDVYDLYTNGWTHPTHLGYALVGTIKAGKVFNPTDVDLNSIGMIKSSGKIGGVSEDLYNAIIGSTGNPILSGDDLLMPEVTTRVWEHFPNRTLIDELGTHNVLRETNSGRTLRIPTPGLMVTLNSPSRPTYVNGNVITFGYPLVEPVQFPVAPYLIGVGASNN